MFEGMIIFSGIFYKLFKICDSAKIRKRRCEWQYIHFVIDFLYVQMWLICKYKRRPLVFHDFLTKNEKRCICFSIIYKFVPIFYF